MADEKIVTQFPRGTTEQHEQYTGLNGELTVDTDKKTLVVHDGETLGGSPLLTEKKFLQVMEDNTINTDYTTIFLNALTGNIEVLN